MSKPKKFSSKNEHNTTQNNRGLHKNKGTPECVGGTPQIKILPRLSSPENKNTESPPSVTGDNRKLVQDFLNEAFYGHDIVCQIKFCSVCTWSSSADLPERKKCPVCGQMTKTVSVIIERDVLSFDDTVLEIKTGK